MGTWYHLALPQAFPLLGEGLAAGVRYCPRAVIEVVSRSARSTAGP